jgi:colanic acid biosynthesis protein WcaH
MDVRDEWIPAKTFAECLDRLPQVCVEVVVTHDGGVLLAQRANPPAEGEWFWPGGRLYKGERLDGAARRVVGEELGLAVELDGRLGVEEHFWEAAAPDGADSRHTVNVVYEVSPADGLDVTLDDQHDDWRLLRAPDPDLHEYVRRYVSAYDLL